jgi:hypothetical protein
MNKKYLIVLLIALLGVSIFFVKSVTLKIIIIVCQILLLIGIYAMQTKDKPDTKVKLIIRVVVTMVIILSVFAYYYFKAVKRL